MTPCLCPALVDLYRTSRAWSTTASFSDVDEKSGMGGDAGDDFAGSRRDTEFRGVHRVIYISCENSYSYFGSDVDTLLTCSFLLGNYLWQGWTSPCAENIEERAHCHCIYCRDRGHV
jgi:hypothetical protein